MPALQHRLVIRDRRFLLLRIAQFEGALLLAAREDRQRYARSDHVLQRTAFPEVSDVQRVETRGAVQLNAWTERSDGNADIGRGRMQLRLSRSNVRPATRQFGRNSEWNARRRRRDQLWPA